MNFVESIDKQMSLLYNNYENNILMMFFCSWRSSNMALIFAIVVTLLTVGFYVSLSSRLNADCFDEKLFKIIREQRKYVLIFGL